MLGSYGRLPLSAAGGGVLVASTVNFAGLAWPSPSSASAVSFAATDALSASLRLRSVCSCPISLRPESA